jgi:hypothetical protein
MVILSSRTPGATPGDAETKPPNDFDDNTGFEVLSIPGVYDEAGGAPSRPGLTRYDG